jgi:hypothetical protein
MQPVNRSSCLAVRRARQICWIAVQGSTRAARPTLLPGRFSAEAWQLPFRTMGHCELVSEYILLPTLPDVCIVPRWRRMRRAAHEGLSKNVVESFKKAQFTEAVLLAFALLAQPATVDNHLRRSAASMIMSVTYDRPPIVSELDSSVKAINDFVARLTRAALPGAHFVEFFPWMRYIPNG